MAEHDISETAFVVNESRARRVDLSEDRFASLWVTPDTQPLWDELAKDVYPHDDVNLGLRCRFYLEHLRALPAGGVFINVAAGFTNYPFLVEQAISTYEVDYPNVMAYKGERVEEFMAEGKLPRRSVSYVGLNLAAPADLGTLRALLPKWIGGKPSLIFMEGLTYYLKRDVVSKLIGMFGSAQVPGSRIAFDYWPTDALTYPVMQRLQRYLQRQFGFTQAWDLLDKDYVRRIQDYAVEETTDIPALDRKWGDGHTMQSRDAIIPAQFVVLRRSSSSFFAKTH